MKQIFILLLAFLFLVGCAEFKPAMSNEKMVNEINKCRQAGMGYHLIYNPFTYRAVEVVCDPK